MYEAETRDEINLEMSRLQRQVGLALARGDRESAEREITLKVVNQETVALVVVDQAGRVMLSNRPVWKGREAQEVLPQYDEGVMEQIRDSHHSLVVTSRQNRFIRAYVPLTLHVSTGMQHSHHAGGIYMLSKFGERYAQITQRMLLQGALIWFAGLLAMLILLLVLRRFVEEPLQLLADTSGQLGQGDQGARLEVIGRGEVADLVHAFNEADSTIRHTIEELNESRGKYRTIVDNVELGILLIDKEHRIVETNRLTRTWFPELADAVGTLCSEQLGNGYASELCALCEVKHVLRNGDTRERVGVIAIGEEPRHLRLIMSPVVDDKGAIQACVVMIEDITERVEAGHELERIDRALRALSSTNGAIIRATEKSQLFDEICSILVGTAKYRMAWIGRAEDDEECTVTPVAHAGAEDGYLTSVRFSWRDDAFGRGPTGISIREGCPYVMRDAASEPNYTLWREASRDHGYASSVSIPLFIGDRVWGALAIFASEPNAFDPQEVKLLTELADSLAYGMQSLRTRDNLQHSEKALRELNAELEQRIGESTYDLQTANHELEAFTYSVSHDLRTSLRSIHGFSQILLNQLGGQLDSQGGHYLERVIKATYRMGELIDDLLSLSHINRQTVQPKVVDLSVIARNIINELHECEPLRSVDVKIKSNILVACDPSLARVMLENLLGNAWKYTGQNKQAKIEFGRRILDGESTCYVNDNGAGFDMRFADKLFAPFQRLHRPDQFEGTGIGLATVQRIVSRHHGRIWADGRPGEGATFYFTLESQQSATEGVSGQDHTTG